MKKAILSTLLFMTIGSGIAQTNPVVGLLEQIPVRDENQKIKARPLYILTEKKLSGPGEFSALQLLGSEINVACCFEVADSTPVDRKSEFDKYGYDPNYISHLKSIKGYRFMYRARAIAKNRWTPAMKSTMNDLADSSDVHPYSLAVIQATFTQPTIPRTFLYAGEKISYTYRYPAGTERVIHSFAFPQSKVEFSEPVVTVDGD